MTPTKQLPHFFPSKDFMTVLQGDDSILLTDIDVSKLRAQENDYYKIVQTPEGAVLRKAQLTANLQDNYASGI
jgi:hypothetical protein